MTRFIREKLEHSIAGSIELIPYGESAAITSHWHEDHTNKTDTMLDVHHAINPEAGNWLIRISARGDFTASPPQVYGVEFTEKNLKRRRSKEVASDHFSGPLDELSLRGLTKTAWYLRKVSR